MAIIRVIPIAAAWYPACAPAVRPPVGGAMVPMASVPFVASGVRAPQMVYSLKT